MLFWPKSVSGVGACCCVGVTVDPDTDCTEACFTVLDANDDPVEGSVISGDVGSCTTDVNGECCITIPDPGEYHFIAEKSGFQSEEITVTVDEADCDDPDSVDVEVDVITTATPNYCIDMKASACGCPLPGATFSGVWGATTLTGVTNLAGIVRFCFTSTQWAIGVTINWTLSKGDYVTQTFSNTSGGFGSGPSGVTYSRTLLHTNSANRFCYHRIDSGLPADEGDECTSVAPNTLQVTLTGGGWGGANGQTVAVTKASNTFTWQSGCVAIQGGGNFSGNGYMSVSVQVARGPLTCGQLPSLLVQVSFTPVADCSLTTQHNYGGFDSIGQNVCPVAGFVESSIQIDISSTPLPTKQFVVSE